jgi:nucleotide-binding universal stress UspA family protein
MNNFGDIVVGYDGSKGSKRAVEFAAAEAAAHQARLRIVTVWNSSMPAAAAMSPLVAPSIAHDRARLAEQRLDEAAVLAHDVAPDVEIQTVAVEGGNVAAELTRATENSRLLVVGCRGHGSVQGLLLGSVSHQCSLHARCPVLIVPAVVDDRPPIRHAASAAQ